MAHKNKIPSLQKKGLLTVLLIVLGESIHLSNAVQFWSTYQNWSNNYGRGRFANHNQQEEEDINSNSNTKRDHSAKIFGDFLKRSTLAAVGKSHSHNQNQECSNSGSYPVPSPLPSKLHPRQLAKAASSLGKRTCSNAMYNCCNSSCPSCLTLDYPSLDIRGGHMQHAATENIADTILSATSSVGSSSSFSPTPYGLPLNMWKVIFQIFLTALNVACWLIPLRAKKITENKLALGLANAFSGGVFLTLAFGHLIPECVHGFEGMNEALPFMIVLFGYLLIFFVEKVAFDAHGLMHEAEHGHGHSEEKSKDEVKKLEGEVEKAPEGVGRSAVILLGALAVHSILEMTALGLARSFGDSALLTLSIALHQVRSLEEPWSLATCSLPLSICLHH